MNRYKLDGFLGNERTVAALLKRVETGRLVHTLLFAGPVGSGKRTLAAAIVRKLFCSDLCGQCVQCRLLARDGHPDFIHLGPEGGSIKLEQAKELKHFLSAPPNSAPKKVAVLENSQCLTAEAGNSLLKILEEPPSTSVCILTADSVVNVLPTLVSRSQVYTLSALPQLDIIDVLQRKGMPQDRIRFLAGYSQGILGRALMLSEAEDFWPRRQQMALEIHEVMSRCKNPLQFSEHWREFPEALDLMEFWFRDMVMLQLRPGYTPPNSDLSTALEGCLAACTKDKALALLRSCKRARVYLQAMCNPRLVFDCLALRLWEV